MAHDLCMNASITEDFEPCIYFTNIFKQSRNWISETAGAGGYASATGGALTLNADGYPILSAGQRAGTLMNRDLIVSGVDSGALYPPGDYVLRYEGTGKLILAFDAVPTAYNGDGYSAAPQSTGRITFQIAAATTAGIYFGIEESNSDPIRNVRICRLVDEPIVDTNPWNPEFLVDVEPFTWWRTLNWQRINYCNYGEDWNARAKLTDARYTTRKGLPVELLADFANRTGKHLWVQIPHKATDAWVTSFADYLAANLNPQILLRVEFSNEVWNDLFIYNPGFSDWTALDGQPYYCEVQGVNEGLDANAYLARLKWYAKRSVQVTNLFRSRFANPSRVTRMVCAQHENGNLEFSNANTILDYVVSGQPTYTQIDRFGTAPYWGINAGALANAQNVIDQCQIELDGNVGTMIGIHSQRAAARGIGYDLYEAGTSPYPTDSAQVVVVKNALYDDQMGPQYGDFFDKCIAANVGLVAIYSYCTKGGTQGIFGHIRRVGEQPRPARWMALEEYAGTGNVTPTNPGSQAKIEALVGFDAGDGKYKLFGGPQPISAMTGSVIDFVGGVYRSLTIAADTLFTFANALRGARVVLEVTGDFRVRFPNSCRILRGRYDGSNGQMNRISVYCREHDGTPVFEVSIETFPAAQTGLIYRQALVTGNTATLFSNWAECLSSPSATPASANRYSRLAEVEKFRRRDGFIYFRVVWPLVAGTDSNPQFYAFRQRNSPLEALSRERVYGFQVTNHNVANPNVFGGLCRTSINEAFLSITPGVVLSVYPYLFGSRQGLTPFLLINNNLFTAPAIVNTSVVELYCD